MDNSLMIISAHTGWRRSADDTRVLRNIALFVKGKNGGGESTAFAHNYGFCLPTETMPDNSI